MNARVCLAGRAGYGRTRDEVRKRKMVGVVPYGEEKRFTGTGRSVRDRKRLVEGGHEGLEGGVQRAWVPVRACG